ncbi:hypothetical protein EVAR_34037_1 [Eumeta japonica]|uniref:Uncharacterized protein n=1 Tax=Eumeta variegata TaxID=151549 RepID=A0A4C1VUR2_EUMVA|nr:hypothetical protein EVAR_34037_1 [Eumeta japonica]
MDNGTAAVMRRRISPAVPTPPDEPPPPPPPPPAPPRVRLVLFLAAYHAIRNQKIHAIETERKTSQKSLEKLFGDLCPSQQHTMIRLKVPDLPYIADPDADNTRYSIEERGGHHKVDGHHIGHLEAKRSHQCVAGLLRNDLMDGIELMDRALITSPLRRTHPQASRFRSMC